MFELETMPRPILKTLSSYASPMRPSSKRERKCVAVRRHVRASRRVTFSPFTKLRENSPTSSRLPFFAEDKEMKGSLTSGFTFSSVSEAEKKKQLRRKEELHIIQAMHLAVMRRPHSVKSLLMANVPGLKRLNTLASKWLDHAKAVRNAVSQRQRPRPKRRPRKLLRSRWTELDDADHQYVQQLALSSTMTHPTLLLSASTSSRDYDCKPLVLANGSPQPNLTQASRGRFTNLLRKEGIPVEEDELQAHRAIGEDLPGVKCPAKRCRF